MLFFQDKRNPKLVYSAGTSFRQTGLPMFSLAATCNNLPEAALRLYT